VNQDVAELGTVRRHVVDDEVHDRVQTGVGECGDVVPGAEPGVDRAVVDRVEARVRAVEGPEERQHVNAPEEPGERAGEERAEPRQVPGQSVRVGDELDLVLHAAGLFQ
jgi:hypothetical protein